MLLTNTVSARDIQRQYKQIFTKVRATKKPVVVISDNKPLAAIISLEMLEEYERERDFSFLKPVWEKTKNLDVKKAEKEITETVKQVRQELYDRQKTRRR